MNVDIPPRLYSAVLAALDLAVLKAPRESLLRVEFDEARRYLEANLARRIERVSHAIEEKQQAGL